MISSSPKRICRICFECDESESLLISPCRCSGTSLHIHQHCLEQWQATTLRSSQLVCPTCLSPYVHASWAKIVSWQYWQQTAASLQTSIARTLHTVVLSPLKFVLHMGLFLLTVPMGRCNIDESHELTWLGLDIPPSLSLIYASPTLIPGLRRGCLLVSTAKMEESNPTSFHFHKVVILVLEHSWTEGSVGIILNRRDGGVQAAVSAPNIFNLVGGPTATNCLTVMHQVATCSLHSNCVVRSSSSSNTRRDCKHLYVAQFDKAMCTVQLLAEAIREDSGIHGGTNNTESATSLPIYLCRGHCQWLPNQLEGEIRAGLWQISSADPAESLQKYHAREEDIWTNLQQPVM